MTNNIVSESTHWYTAEGQPFYEIENKSKPGEMRAVTLRDAKKLGLFPSVTSILKIIAQPGLQQWIQQQILLAAATSPYKRSEMSADEWASKVLADAQEQAEKARQKGVEIHGAIEKYLSGQTIEERIVPFVIPVIQEMEKRGMLENRKVEHSFANPLGFGGKIDYHNDAVLIDFKSKEFDDLTKKLAWDEHSYQLAGYRYGLHMPHLKCFNVFISTNVPGLFQFYEWTEEDLKKGLEVFLAALTLWKRIKLYSIPSK